MSVLPEYRCDTKQTKLQAYVCWRHMKNKINYGTPQHNNDKDKKCTNNSQKDPGVSGDLARPTALSLAPHALLTASNKHTRSANVPVINQLQKTQCASYQSASKTLSQLHCCTKHAITWQGKLSIDKIQQQLFLVTGWSLLWGRRVFTLSYERNF